MPEYRSKYVLVASLDIVVVCDLSNAVFNTISNAARLKYCQSFGVQQAKINI